MTPEADKLLSLMHRHGAKVERMFGVAVVTFTPAAIAAYGQALDRPDPKELPVASTIRCRHCGEECEVQFNYQQGVKP